MNDIHITITSGQVLILGPTIVSGISGAIWWYLRTMKQKEKLKTKTKTQKIQLLELVNQIIELKKKEINHLRKENGDKEEINKLKREIKALKEKYGLDKKNDGP